MYSLSPEVLQIRKINKSKKGNKVIVIFVAEIDLKVSKD